MFAYGPFRKLEQLSALQQEIERDASILSAEDKITGDSLMDYFIRKNLVENVNFLLSRDVEINYENKVRKRTPLHTVVEGGNEGMLMLLLTYPKLDINIECEQRTALHIAVNKGNILMAQRLLENGIDSNVIDRRNMNALHWAAARDDYDMARVIIEKSKRILAVDRYKDAADETCWSLVKRKWPDLVPLLSRKSREYSVLRDDIPAFTGDTFFDDARCGMRRAVEEFLRAQDLKYHLNCAEEDKFVQRLAGYDENVFKIQSYVVRELLIQATRRDMKRALESILQSLKPCDADIKDAVVCAARKGTSADILRTLIYAIRVLPSNFLDNVLLEICQTMKLSSSNEVELTNAMVFLLYKGANPNVEDDFGATPLHSAAAATNKKAVRILLSRGCDSTKKNVFGVSPQDLAPNLF